MLKGGKVKRLGVSVPVIYAEKARGILKERSAIDPSLKPLRIDDRVVFPLKQDLPSLEGAAIPGLECKLVWEEFQERHLTPRSIREALSGIISGELLKKLPSSYDIVGDIAVVHIPEGLETLGGQIGEAIIRVNPSVKVVLGKAGPVTGVYRTQRLIHLAGEVRTVTTHKEHGCIFQVDLEKVYFNPRLAGERMRIARLTRSDEVVADMFAGVGPFAIAIAKHAGARVFASEINPDAYGLLVKNIQINKLTGRVVPLFGDCRTAYTNNQIRADRVVMNYPSDPLSFLDTALRILRGRGVVHLYGFAKDPEELRPKIVERVTEFGATCDLMINKLKPVSPSRSLVVADIEVCTS
ncbi:tRNA (guanine(26)-N(2))-dimethyltransferase [Candidatus Calditenuaceae archaeon HR02]|nr:tRNA (guanine(26)-N(2))-dimethyltransferase [Candidatus Calditenuaceae archaeon HR02]